MFNRLPFINDVMKDQIASEKLDVDGIGTFDVDLHLGGDLKTIMCMLGCKPGANSLFPCLFCVRGYKKKGNRAKQKKRPLVIEDKNDNLDEYSQVEDREWDGGSLSCPLLEVPNRSSKDPTSNPIIAFPLDNVHFCTLHAFMQIFDHLLKLHVDFAFTMKPVECSIEALIKVEELLNSIGCHGGNVQILVKKDTGDTHEVAQQVSMSGGKSQRFFAKPPKKPSRKRSSQVQEQDKQWEL